MALEFIHLIMHGVLDTYDILEESTHFFPTYAIVEIVDGLRDFTFMRSHSAFEILAEVFYDASVIS